jgi:muconolactone delta-isomerase
MKRILVSISLSPEGMSTIRATPELQKAEMAFIEQWKAEGILESFFISTDRTGAFLLFNGVERDRVKELIGILPYFPYMAKVDHFELDKQF